MNIALVDESAASGASRRAARAVLGVSARVVERWKVAKSRGKVEDLRRGPRKAPVKERPTTKGKK